MKTFLMAGLVSLQMLHANIQIPVIAGYYENWSQYRPGVGGRPQFTPNLIDPTILTDINYAFGVFGFVTRSVDPQNPHLTGNYFVEPVEWNDQSVLYPQIQQLKLINPLLRTHLSIGGWSFNDPNDPNGMGGMTYRLFSEMVSSSANRTQFINSAIDYAHTYGFNGIDIDWEYPGDLTRGGTEDDFDNFLQFLQELYTACHLTTPPLYVTYASPAIVPAGVPDQYHQNQELYFQWLAACSEYLDWLNLMCYDYHGPFDNLKLTGVNAPLKQDTNLSSPLFIDQTISDYLKGGVPANKIVLGMPTYGHSYSEVTHLTTSDYAPGKPFQGPGSAGPATGQPGLLAYFEIADMIANQQLTFGVDTPTSTAIAFNSNAGSWVSFDTPDTIALKAQTVVNNALLGAMFWAIDDDEYYFSNYPNITSAYQVLHEAKFCSKRKKWMWPEIK